MTVITGENGAGKTSLLEAIGYVSTLRSFRGSPKEALVRRGATCAIVRAELDDAGRRVLVEIEIDPVRRDRVQLNRQRVSRSEDLLEALRVSVFTPDDLLLVKGGPELRRDFLDTVLESARPRLAGVRRAVERSLRQRNSLLRQAGGRLTDEIATTLDVWDTQLGEAGATLVAAREALVRDLGPHAMAAFGRLTRIAAPLELSYRRSFEGELAQALAASRSEDLRRGTTTLGPQRDELVISCDGLDARTRLSQGRQRSVALALRLAAHEVVAATTGTRPVLLLDDAFSELDQQSAAALLEELGNGQALLTTAGAMPEGLIAARLLRLRSGRLEAKTP
jgi:DNA replication and repair protein RecF